MKVRVKVPPSPFRLLKERYFGEETRNPWVARNALTSLSARLPADVVPIVSQAVHSLIEYQDPDYALLYIERIERYIGPRGPLLPTLGELASLLSQRMQFADPIRIAQLKLTEIGGASAKPDRNSSIQVERFRWDEIIQMLPSVAAAKAQNVFARLRLARLSNRTVTLRFRGTGYFSLLRLRGLTALRISRPFSQRFKAERTWVERWLHMVDRTLVKQPAAAAEVVKTAMLVRGHGDQYQHSLSKWNVIIDSLVKPTCDDTLPLQNLSDAVRDARQAAMEEAGNSRLLHVIEHIRAEARRGSGADTGSGFGS
ncbi:DUF6537 domain-containing protein [Bradyrhizobium sp. SYSU BS000235]|uniref:DUF6537 domain-containing protein n=1 Tax=Bradyrhizobium sp. SYSU BS000235 TaxID=3411332 RepID=UPI003C796D6A